MRRFCYGVATTVFLLCCAVYLCLQDVAHVFSQSFGVPQPLEALQSSSLQRPPPFTPVYFEERNTNRSLPLYISNPLECDTEQLDATIQLFGSISQRVVYVETHLADETSIRFICDPAIRFLRTHGSSCDAECVQQELRDPRSTTVSAGCFDLRNKSAVYISLEEFRVIPHVAIERLLQDLGYPSYVEDDTWRDQTHQLMVQPANLFQDDARLPLLKAYYRKCVQADAVSQWRKEMLLGNAASAKTGVPAKTGAPAKTSLTSTQPDTTVCIVSKDSRFSPTAAGTATFSWNLETMLKRKTNFRVIHLHVGKESCADWNKLYNDANIELGCAINSRELTTHPSYTNCDVFVTHEWDNPMATHILKRKISNDKHLKPVITVVHGGHRWANYDLNWKEASISQVNKYQRQLQTMRLSDYLVYPSRHMQLYHAWHYRGQSKHWNVMGNTQDQSMQPRVRTRELFKPKCLAFFARVQPRKGILLFADALKELEQNVVARARMEIKNAASPQDAFPVYVIGNHDSPRTSMYLEATREAVKYVFHIDVRGAKPAAEALAFLQKEQCLVVAPSYIENSPYVLAEFMQHNIPFVTLDVGGVREMMHEEDMEDSLIHEASSHAVAAAIERAFTKPHGVAAPRMSPHLWNDEERWIKLLQYMAHSDALRTPSESVDVVTSSLPLLKHHCAKRQARQVVVLMDMPEDMLLLDEERLNAAAAKLEPHEWLVPGIRIFNMAWQMVYGSWYWSHVSSPFMFGAYGVVMARMEDACRDALPMVEQQNNLRVQQVLALLSAQPRRELHVLVHPEPLYQINHVVLQESDMMPRETKYVVDDDAFWRRMTFEKQINTCRNDRWWEAVRSHSKELPPDFAFSAKFQCSQSCIYNFLAGARRAWQLTSVVAKEQVMPHGECFVQWKDLASHMQAWSRILNALVTPN